MTETIESQAANARLDEFMGKAKAFQRSEKMSQETFANYCDISKGAWFNMIHQKRKGSSLVLVKISVATGISI